MPTPPQTSHLEPNPSLQFDWEEWLPMVACSDLTDDQKKEMIETLWSIVLAFVDLGWEIVTDPQETGGQVLDLRAALEAAVLNSTDTETADQNRNASENLAAPNEESLNTN